MPLKTFLFNRGIFTQIVRNVGWVSLIYFIGLLFALPIHIFMMSENKDWLMHHQTGRIFDIGSIIQFSLMFTLPILLAIFLFRYMQVKRSADHMHSLPIKREVLFLQHIVVGMIILIVPITIVAICLIVMKPFLPIPLYSFKHVAIWFVSTVAMNLLLFSGAVFVGMLTGMSILQGMFAYILFFFPAGIFILLIFNLKYFLYGFAYEYYLSSSLNEMIPFIQALNWETERIQPLEILIYTVLTFMFYGLSIWLYKKRHVEMATDAIVFRPLRPVFTYGFTFCVMLVGGAYFGQMQQKMSWVIFGYVFSSLFGYIIALMILAKTWRVFSRWKEYMGYVVFMSIVGLLFTFDLFGYKAYQPSLNEIERAYFGDHIYFLENDEIDEENAFYYEKENIRNIYLFHQHLIEQRTYPVNDRRNVVIGYDLKNGKRIVREYTVPMNLYNQFYKPIFNSIEFKKNHYPILRKTNFEDILQIRIGSEDKVVRLQDRADIESFLAVLQQQLLHETFDETTTNRSWGTISILYEKYEEQGIEWRKSYHLIEQWLQDRGLLQQARVTADDIAEIKIIKNTKQVPQYEWTPEMIEREKAKMVVHDKEKIEQCLQMATWGEGDYILGIYYKNGRIDIQAFSKDFVPPFVH
ncbi:MAG: ABC transporter permease [Anoxybacillus gonensis]|nr:ABC transporter permease [Anoxybacillus gonensis]